MPFLKIAAQRASGNNVAILVVSPTFLDSVFVETDTYFFIRPRFL